MKSGLEVTIGAIFDRPSRRPEDRLSCRGVMAIRRCLRLCALAVVLWPAGTAAQESHVSVSVGEEGVTLKADNARLRDVLAEWARVGGFRLLDYDTLDTRTVTLQLEKVPEREALNILLRDIGGYVLGARGAGDSGRSQFGSLLVVSGSAPSPRPGGFAAVPPPPPVVPAVAALDTPREIQEEEPQIGLLGGNGRVTAAPPISGSNPVDSQGGFGPVLADVAGPDSTLTPLDQRPPTPLMRPFSGPDAANPFGRPLGAATPGTIVGTPPPRILYPPVTEQNLGMPPGATAVTSGTTTTPK